MRQALTYTGIGLAAVGTALILFWVLLQTMGPQQTLSPIPLQDPVNVIYTTPGR